MKTELCDKDSCIGCEFIAKANIKNNMIIFCTNTLETIPYSRIITKQDVKDYLNNKLK
jgi:hypothetical protein